MILMDRRRLLMYLEDAVEGFEEVFAEAGEEALRDFREVVSRVRRFVEEVYDLGVDEEDRDRLLEDVDRFGERWSGVVEGAGYLADRLAKTIWFANEVLMANHYLYLLAEQLKKTPRYGEMYLRWVREHGEKEAMRRLRKAILREIGEALEEGGEV